MGSDPNLINPPPQERESFTTGLEERRTKRKAHSADQLSGEGRLQRVAGPTAEAREAREAARKADIEASRRKAEADTLALAQSRGQTVEELHASREAARTQNRRRIAKRYPGPGPR